MERNPQDVTLRNNQARKKEIRELKAEVRDLNRRVSMLEGEILRRLVGIEKRMVAAVKAAVKSKRR